MLLVAKQVGSLDTNFYFIFSPTTASVCTVVYGIYAYSVSTNRISKTEFKQNQIITTQKEGLL